MMDDPFFQTARNAERMKNDEAALAVFTINAYKPLIQWKITIDVDEF